MDVKKKDDFNEFLRIWNLKKVFNEWKKMKRWEEKHAEQ